MCLQCLMFMNVQCVCWMCFAIFRILATLCAPKKDNRKGEEGGRSIKFLHLNFEENMMTGMGTEKTLLHE